MRIQIYEDNGSRFHWMLAADDGQSLATSTETFATRDAAVQAADPVAKAASVTIEAG